MLLALGVAATLTLTLALAAAPASAQAECRFLDATGQPAGAGFEVVAGGEVRLQIVAADENTRAQRYDDALVELQAELSGDRTDYLLAIETGRDTGIFEATVELGALVGGASADPWDNVLETELSDTLELVYYPYSGFPCVATATVVPTALRLVDERASASVADLAAAGGPAEVLADGALRLRLLAPGLDTDKGVAETTVVGVQSAIEGDSESVTLTETDLSTGIFEAVLPLATDYAQAGNGILETEGFELPDPLLADTVVVDHASGAHAEALVISARLGFYDTDGALLSAEDGIVLGQVVRLRLDRPIFQDDLSADSLQVSVATAAGDQETLTLQETGPATSIFEVDLQTSASAVAVGDGMLQGSVGGETTALHADPYLATDAKAIRGFVGSRTRILIPYGAEPGEVFQTGDFEVEVMNFAASGSVSVTVSSMLAADNETVSLAQVSPGVFRGTVSTDLTPGRNQVGTPGDGVLTTTGDYGPPVDDTDEVRITYSAGAGSPSSDRATPVGSRSAFVDLALEPVDVYTEGPARLRVVSPAKNQYPGMAETVRVNLHPEVPDSEDYEEVVLEETGPDTGIFVAEIPIDTSMPASTNDGIVQASVGDLLGFAHFDNFLSTVSNGWVTVGGPIEAPRPPVAVNDTATTPEDTPLTIDVLANDSDPNGDPLTVFLAQANRGSVTIEADGRLTYLPEADFYGQARIDYEIRDPSGLEAGASVYVTVTPVNDAPIAEINPPYETSGPAPFYFQVSAWSSHDPDGSIVDYSWDFGDGTTANGEQYQHVFETAGTYVVTLTVTDDQGATDTDTLTFEVITEYTVLFVVAPDDTTGLLRPGDRAVADHLESQNWLVQWVPSTVVQGSDADGFDLVLISSTPTSASINSKFRDVTVPVVTWEPFILDDMGMTPGVANTDYGGVDAQTSVEIADASHPLAAGLSGTPILTTQPERYTFGRPVASAIAIGRNLERVERLHVFAYDKASPMASLTAPARRVSLFLGDDTALLLTADGWALFDAALCWAVNCEGEAVARFAATPVTPEALALDFDGTASEAGPEATPVDWTWDFGDGTTASGGAGVADTVGHTYARGGTYTVTLEVTDSKGRVDSASQAIVVGPTPSAALFVVGSTSLGAGDAAVLSRLQALGLGVTVVGQTDAKAADAVGRDLVAISSTVQSSSVGRKFRDVAVPVVTWESHLFDDMALTDKGTNTHYGVDGGQTQVVITDPSHPIADGLSGTVDHYSSAGDLRWGVPSANASVVGTSPADPTHASLFAYEAGASMVGLAAPARRVALPYGDDGPANLASAGSALFDAALEWALGLR